jgi:hypothetical protein
LVGVSGFPFADVVSLGRFRDAIFDRLDSDGLGAIDARLISYSKLIGRLQISGKTKNDKIF